MTEPASGGYFRQHTALANWLSAADSGSAKEILEEDAKRSARLELLHAVVGLPIIESTTFRGEELIDEDRRLREYVDRAVGPYAIRILFGETVVNRNRNLSARQLVDWALAQGDLEAHIVELSRHIPNQYSVIFVSGEDGTIGEAVEGSLRVLTHGGPSSGAVVAFWVDRSNEEIRPAFGQAIEQDAIGEFVAVALQQTDLRKADDTTLATLRDAGFEPNALGLMRGYFEAIGGPSGDIYFIDANRAIGNQIDAELIAGFTQAAAASDALLHGTPASTGTATGPAFVIVRADAAVGALPAGAVVVCEEPGPQLIEQLPSIAALVVDRGGVLAHASIVCRELGIPCIVGVGNATELIPNGAVVKVDGGAGVVTVLEPRA